LVLPKNNFFCGAKKQMEVYNKSDKYRKIFGIYSDFVHILIILMQGKIVTHDLTNDFMYHSNRDDITNIYVDNMYLYRKSNGIDRTLVYKFCKNVSKEKPSKYHLISSNTIYKYFTAKDKYVKLFYPNYNIALIYHILRRIKKIPSYISYMILSLLFEFPG
jgi:hypothetical protein